MDGGNNLQFPRIEYVGSEGMQDLLHLRCHYSEKTRRCCATGLTVSSVEILCLHYHHRYVSLL